VSNSTPSRESRQGRSPKSLGKDAAHVEGATPDTGAWEEARPCPVCGRDGWCSVSADGAVCACKRVEEGAFTSRETSAGWTNFYHRLREPLPGERLFRPQAGPPRASPGQLHETYSAILRWLGLAACHRKALRGRGLPGAEIDARSYATLPAAGLALPAEWAGPPPDTLPLRLRDGLMVGVRKRRGLLAKVPGVYRDGITYRLTGPPGLLVPVRDDRGRIVALVVRRDGEGDAPKYLWLSSRKHGGPGPGAPAHWPDLGQWVKRCGVDSLRTVRITEGQLKADIATARSGTYTLGAPGCSAWRPALEALRHYHVETVRLAFDQDSKSNPTVARAQLECARAAREMGFEVEVERW
jgi:hypothetical protein